MGDLPRLASAFERLRFGPTRTLNVRDTRPTGGEAARRVEQWLRLKQVEGPGALLVITGRGAGSAEGVAVVRDAVARTLRRLARQGVVAAIQEQTAGSFVVTVAPLRALFEAPTRTRARHRAPGTAPATRPITGLAPASQERLRALARRALEALGVRDAADRMIDDEAERQFSLLAAGAPPGVSADVWIQAAAARAIRDYDDAPA